MARRMGIEEADDPELAELAQDQGCIKPVKPGNGSKKSMRFVGTSLLD